MAQKVHSERFPGESARYRTARNRLLAAETELRKNVERVARRGLVSVAHVCERVSELARVIVFGRAF